MQKNWKAQTFYQIFQNGGNGLVEEIVLKEKIAEKLNVVVDYENQSIENMSANPYDLGVSTCRLGLNTDWLPASEIWGEGVFLQLDETAVRQWEDRPDVQERSKQLEAGYDAWAEGRGNVPDFPEARFYLLHSLSHMLINAIAVECGYSAAALSERLYCASRDAAVPMAAILISTGSFTNKHNIRLRIS